MTFDYNAAGYMDTTFSEDTPLSPPKKRGRPKTSASLKKIRPTENLLENFAASYQAAAANGEKLNPYLNGFDFDLRKASGDLIETEILTDESGAKVETRHTVVKIVDRGQFLKIYPEMLGAIFDMDKPGIKMLSVLLNTIRENDGKDRLTLSWDEKIIFKGASGPVELSRSGFYRGMKALEDLKIIAPVSRGSHEYWINPSFLFNGSRVSFATRFIQTHR